MNLSNIDWLFTLGAWVLGVGGLVLLAWALFRDRSRGRRRCPKCWYDMANTPGLLCPECGRTAKHEKKFFRTRRRWRWAVVGLLVALAGPTVLIGRTIARAGFWGAVPFKVLVVGRRTMLLQDAPELTLLGGMIDGEYVKRVLSAQKVTDGWNDELNWSRRIILDFDDQSDRSVNAAIQTYSFIGSIPSEETGLLDIELLDALSRMHTQGVAAKGALAILLYQLKIHECDISIKSKYLSSICDVADRLSPNECQSILWNLEEQGIGTWGMNSDCIAEMRRRARHASRVLPDVRR